MGCVFGAVVPTSWRYTGSPAVERDIHLCNRLSPLHLEAASVDRIDTCAHGGEHLRAEGRLVPGQGRVDAAGVAATPGQRIAFPDHSYLAPFTSVYFIMYAQGKGGVAKQASTKPGQAAERRVRGPGGAVDRAAGLHARFQGEQWCRGECRSCRQVVRGSSPCAGAVRASGAIHEALRLP